MKVQPTPMYDNGVYTTCDLHLFLFYAALVMKKFQTTSRLNRSYSLVNISNDDWQLANWQYNNLECHTKFDDDNRHQLNLYNIEGAEQFLPKISWKIRIFCKVLYRIYSFRKMCIVADYIAYAYDGADYRS